MGRFIIKIDDRYLEWSTVVDAPVTYGMTREQFEEYYRAQYGEHGMSGLPERMERVEKYGTSSRDGESAEDFTAYNRAGEGETCISLDEIRAKYVYPDTTDERGGAETDG